MSGALGRRPALAPNRTVALGATIVSSCKPIAAHVFASVYMRERTRSHTSKRDGPHIGRFGRATVSMRCRFYDASTMRARWPRPMRNLKTVVSSAVALSALVATVAPGFADTESGFYLANSPGNSVQYLSLIDTGRFVSGYLEAIRVTPATADGQTRVQTFSSPGTGALSFGTSMAVRTANGYILTSMTPEGQVVQQRFAKANAQTVNAAILALSVSVSRARAKSQLDSARASARTYSAMSSDDAARLAKAQIAVDTASAQLSDAQRSADRLSTLARQARADANAAIDKSGVSLAQNQSRIAAMKTADDAEQSVIIAQRTANIASNALGVARAEVARLRLQMANVPEQTRATAGVGP